MGQDVNAHTNSIDHGLFVCPCNANIVNSGAYAETRKPNENCNGTRKWNKNWAEPSSIDTVFARPISCSFVINFCFAYGTLSLHQLN